MARPHRSLLIGACATLAVVAAACGSDDDGGELSLADTSWTAAEVEGYDLAGTLEVAFADGNISVTGGCNTQNGAYELVDGVLTAGPMMSTMMACEDDLMAQDAWIAVLLEEGVDVEQDGSTLIWSTDDVTITLQSA